MIFSTDKVTCNTRDQYLVLFHSISTDRYPGEIFVQKVLLRSWKRKHYYSYQSNRSQGQIWYNVYQRWQWLSI